MITTIYLISALPMPLPSYILNQGTRKLQKEELIKSFYPRRIDKIYCPETSMLGLKGITFPPYLLHKTFHFHLTLLALNALIERYTAILKRNLTVIHPMNSIPTKQKRAKHLTWHLALYMLLLYYTYILVLVASTSSKDNPVVSTIKPLSNPF